MIESIICCCFAPYLRMNGQNLTKSSNFGGIPPLTTELAALEHLKNLYISLKALAPKSCELVGSS